jgi:hypothetical protein
MPPNLFHLFECLSESARNKKIKKGFRFVWHTVIWSLWRARNNVIFNSSTLDPQGIVEEVKVLSWKWSADCLRISPCLLYEWEWARGIVLLDNVPAVFFSVVFFLLLSSSFPVVGVL